ncbi:MAG: hypothetical protein OEZ21_08625 [Candidatus Bathyarchaeota archaeon]|nr:hypothetical protein [Candidatus Bathyarchaeota archaeon]MDH5747002.1 hypothetical protein [Candidatus Bathyarchaeota archaeon]
MELEDFVYLAKLGFEVPGTEISETGLMETKSASKKEGSIAEPIRSFSRENFSLLG